MALRDYLALDDVGFRTMFRGSPVKRTKRRGLLRNVCVALGNVGDAGDLPALERATADPEPLVVEHARWAIARIQARLAANGVECKADSQLACCHERDRRRDATDLRGGAWKAYAELQPRICPDEAGGRSFSVTIPTTFWAN